MSKRPNPVALMLLLREIGGNRLNKDRQERLADVGTSLNRHGAPSVVPDQEDERVKTVH